MNILGLNINRILFEHLKEQIAAFLSWLATIYPAFIVTVGCNESVD